MLPLSFLAIGVLAYGVSAQTAAFENTTWGDVVNGQIWPIAWTEGDGHPVSLFVGNDTWQWTVFANHSATPGYFEWTVSVPVAGRYHLGLVQSNQLSVSPSFVVGIPIPPSPSTTWTTSPSWETLHPTANATLIYATSTYWDNGCGCSKTSISIVPQPTVTATYDEACGCMKPTAVPAHPVAPVSNGTLPAPNNPGTNVPLSPPAPAAPTGSMYTGNANKLIGSSFGVVALVAAALLA
ncbi:hypothetical protein LTR84_009431 [Exophiala bonariae]|uniref:Uncharacterized protein n=1 Tax=Exophiala bonariae TaxID=1690606 RepID=A0AAV9MXV2_9EURO|nr:hypothetical protein LTR84_009431 [Exophiala bonariae]